MAAEPKYVIEASIRTDGTVQRKDVVGAIFGQTEGLLGESLQLRQMQRKGRIGHVDVELENQRGKVQGIIRLPTMIDQVTTAVIGASLETIDRIGPCQAVIKVNKIENVRSAKRTQVVDRAKDLLIQIVNAGSEDSSNILDEVRSVLTLGTETDFNGMTCGPNALESNALIIVEGRNDVRNLLKHGIKNAIATMGAGITKELVELASSKKNVTAFMDGDRGGTLLLVELEGALGKSLTHVALAPQSREVEHLEGKVITKCLNQKEVASKVISRLKSDLDKEDLEALGKKEDLTPIEVPEQVREWKEMFEGLAKNKACFVLEEGKHSEHVGASKLASEAENISGAVGMLFNGKVTSRTLEIANSAGVVHVLASSVNEDTLDGIEVYVLSDL
jgi:DNA primase